MLHLKGYTHKFKIMSVASFLLLSASTSRAGLADSLDLIAASIGREVTSRMSIMMTIVAAAASQRQLPSFVRL